MHAQYLSKERKTSANEDFPVVPQWFDKKRALAMGIASSGASAGYGATSFPYGSVNLGMCTDQRLSH